MVKTHLSAVGFSPLFVTDAIASITVA